MLLSLGELPAVLCKSLLRFCSSLLWHKSIVFPHVYWRCTFADFCVIYSISLHTPPLSTKSSFCIRNTIQLTGSLASILIVKPAVMYFSCILLACNAFLPWSHKLRPSKAVSNDTGWTDEASFQENTLRWTLELNDLEKGCEARQSSTFEAKLGNGNFYILEDWTIHFPD